MLSTDFIALVNHLFYEAGSPSSKHDQILDLLVHWTSAEIVLNYDLFVSILPLASLSAESLTAVLPPGHIPNLENASKLW